MALPQLGKDTDFENVEKSENKVWECGSPYTFPLPTPKEEPWSQILNPLLKSDTARCKAWKDEVQNLLTFAGLFSAVVTTFVVESQKSLKPDPIEVLLTQLVAQTGSSPTDIGTDTDILPTTLWFLSLVLSLATALIGIVALQWLREHERSYAHLETQIALSLHQMQAESLDKWFVPQVFAILPVLLQLALVLFLVGLSEFLWGLNRVVAIWASVAVGLTLIFLLATTVSPGIQSFLLFIPFKIGQQPRSPCPYKSPQSWLFHRLLSILVRPFMHFSKIPLGQYQEIDSRNLTSAQARSDWGAGIPRGTGLLFRNKVKDSWLEHGIAWLFQRDFEYMAAASQEGPAEVFSQRPVPLYDAVRALLNAKHAEFSHTTFSAVDRCLDAVLTANNIENEKPYARFLHRLSLSFAQPLTCGLPPSLTPADSNVLQEDAALRLFARNGGFAHLPPDAVPRTIEMCLRLTAWMFGGKEARPSKIVRELNSGLRTQNLPLQWVADIISNTSIGLDTEVVQESNRQVRLTILSFFRRTNASVPSQLGSNLDNNEVSFLFSAVRVLAREKESYDICNDILCCIQGEGPGKEKAYHAALMFCLAILTHLAHSPTPSPCPPSLSHFIRSIHKYYEEPENPGGYLKRPRPDLFDSYWPKFVNRAKSLGVELDNIGHEHMDEAGNDKRPHVDKSLGHSAIDMPLDLDKFAIP